MPDWKPEILRRLAPLKLAPTREAEIAEELSQHLDDRYQELVANGQSQHAAFRAALEELKGEDLLAGSLKPVEKNFYREPIAPGAASNNFLSGIFQDVRYALRMLRKSPGFTAVAVLTLALGIGANTAIFSAVNGIWLEPLIYAHSSRLVTVDLLSIPEIQAIRKQATAFERTAIFQGHNALVLGGAVPTQTSSSYVSDDFFPLLGVKPLLGRPILPADTQPGHALVAVLSYGLWNDEFGSDPHIVGRTISVDHKPCTVVGVMPRGLDLGVRWGDDSPGLWMPFVYSPSDPSNLGLYSNFVARLKNGVTIAKVKAQLNAIYARLAAEYPDQYPKALRDYGRIVTAGVNGQTNPNTGRALLILLSAAGFVLLMACVNVASLLVARSWTRQTELAIRKALGATRLRIVRQLSSESLLLAITGGAFGLVISLWGIHLLRVLAPPYTPRVDYMRLDGNVLLFTIGISLFSAVLVGLAPALHASSRQVGGTLKGGLVGSFAGVAMRQSHRFRSALVVVEVMLSVIVVAGGALMARSFYDLMHLSTGVRASHVLTMRVDLSNSVCTYRTRRPRKKNRAPSRSRTTTKADQKVKLKQGVHTMACALASENILNGIRPLPGVARIALSGGGLFQGGWATTSERYPGGPANPGLWVEGNSGNRLSGLVEGRTVTPGFFATLGIHLLKGRDFDSGDLVGPPVAIVSESFARKYIPGDPLGKRFSVGTEKNGGHPWTQIVGEVNDVRDRAVHEYSGPVYYVPVAAESNWGQMQVIVRTSADPMILVPAIERVVRSVDQDAPITNIETVDQIIANSAAEPRFQTFLLGSFGALGLLLAIVGIYGVISYSVVQRTHEIGVRMALGAEPKDVLRMLIREGMLLAGTGIVLGIGGALALTRFLSSFLFEIKPTDPATFAAVAILLVLVTLAACYVPARRAMRVDPMVALRYE